jgi:hypothetical protein
MRSNDEAAMKRGRIRGQQGQVLPIMALFLVIVAGLMVMTIDFARVYIAQQQLQNAVNASALAAGQKMPNDSSALTAADLYDGANTGTVGKNALFGYDVTATAPTVTFECRANAINYSSGTCPSDTSTADTGALQCNPAGSTPASPSVSTCNAVAVTETATVKSIFGGLIFPSWHVSATAVAAARGGNTEPLHVYVIMDNTDSMDATGCGIVSGPDLVASNPTANTISTADLIDCSKSGVQAFLEAMLPCSGTGTCGTATANIADSGDTYESVADGDPQLGANVASPTDEIGILVFPGIELSTNGGTGTPAANTPVGDEIDCNGSDSFTTIIPSYTSYTYSASSTDGGIPSSDDYLGYQAIGLSSDYRTSDSSATLNPTSDLVQAVDWGQCGSGGTTNAGGSTGTPPSGSTSDYWGLKRIGGEGSYLAGAITEAQHLLDINSVAGTKNVIIIESDGDLNSPTCEPNSQSGCSGKGNSSTFKYYATSIASGVTTDPNPCGTAVNAAQQAQAAGTTMYAIDYASTSVDAQSCGDSSDSYTHKSAMQGLASNSNDFFNDPTETTLVAAFKQTAVDLTDARLIPANCTNAPPAC